MALRADQSPHPLPLLQLLRGGPPRRQPAANLRGRHGVRRRWFMADMNLSCIGLSFLTVPSDSVLVPMHAAEKAQVRSHIERIQFLTGQLAVVSLLPRL